MGGERDRFIEFWMGRWRDFNAKGWGKVRTTKSFGRKLLRRSVANWTYIAVGTESIFEMGMLAMEKGRLVRDERCGSRR